MNRKFEDKLARLAFGETSPKESSALERKVQSDPEAARALAEYQNLKIGLNLLTDVPPDQLSKERLRDAILGQGLRPLPAENPPRWGWAWMPATAAALAFAWIGVRHMSAPGPQVILPTADSMVALKSTSNLTARSFSPAITVAKPSPKVLPEKAGEDHSAHLVVKRHTAGQPDKTVLAVNNLIAKDKPTTVASIDKKTPQAPAPAPADQPDPNGKLVSDNRPLVVINPENDNNSGAQKATEVDGASDVGPVGG